MKKHNSSKIIMLLVTLMIIFALLLTVGCTRAASVVRHADGSTLFMSYAGSILPLTMRGDSEGITATRDVTFDFGGGIQEARVVDSYTLTNNTNEDKTVTIFYPFAGSFGELYRLLPTIAADGRVLETEVFAGSVANDMRSWEDYLALLYDGSYLSHAMADAPELSQTVIVYEFTNARADHGAAVNPMLAASFHLDYDRTTVLTYGFHSGRFDAENGFMQQGFSVPRDIDPRRESSFYLIIVGDDIENLTVRGYTDGGLSVEMDGVTVDMTRYEAILGDILRLLIDDFWNFDIELFYRESAKLLAYAIAPETTAERRSQIFFGTGWLEDIFSHTQGGHRVFYLTTNITIPAGESVTLQAEMIKPASFDFPKGSPNIGLFGYSILTNLDGGVVFDSITAGIIGAEHIRIERENFGFDLENGIVDVPLDSGDVHFYIKVRSAARN